MKRNTNEEIGLRILAARKKMGYSQEELSFLLNIKKSTLCKYEKGYSAVTAELIGEIASFLNTSTDYLIYGVQAEEEWVIEMISILGKIEDPKMRRLAKAQVMCIINLVYK